MVVPCAGGGHRVRLAGGLRFLASARCPVCRTGVDPTRLRRLGRVLRNLLGPATGSWPHRLVWAATLLFLAGIVVTAVLIQRYGDLWWPATVLLFAPRWVLALPLVLLVPAVLRLDRALLLPLLTAALIVPGPVLGWRTGWRGMFQSSEPGRDLVVVTLNAEGGRGLLAHPLVLLQDWEVDVAAFQECGRPLRDRLEEMPPTWHLHLSPGLCLASRYPIVEVEQMERPAEDFDGGSGWVISYRLDVDGTGLTVTNLHLETPRAGLEDLQGGRIRRGIRRLGERTWVREVEMRQARRWVESREGPHVVMGDFNAPPESRILRTHWGDMVNAFSHVGRGIGASRVQGPIRARIDHILLGPEWTVVWSRVEADVGSDHRPVLARIRLERDLARGEAP